MKSESPFSKLPSLGELLNHPTVARVVKRVNQTTIAQRATGFLEELQTNILQRTDGGHVPSLGQLAERLARRLLGPAVCSTPCVNATGILFGNGHPTPPLAEAAVDELVRNSTEYLARDPSLSERATAALVESTGAESALVSHSFAVAEKTARSVGGNVVVARYAGLLNPGDYGLAHFETITSRLEGADLVVVDGAGLLGGPPCGIVLGNSEKVAECVRHAPLDEGAANDLTLAATLGHDEYLSIWRPSDSSTTALATLDDSSGESSAARTASGDAAHRVQTSCLCPTDAMHFCLV